MATRTSPRRAAKRTKMDGKTAEIQQFIDETNAEYERVHRAFENQFWGTKMALKKGDFSTEQLGSTKEAMEAFLRDADRLARAKAYAADARGEQLKVLDCFQRTFACYQMASEEAVALRKASTEIEDALNEQRNKMRLGYDHAGAFVEKSSVGLRTAMRTDDDESVREAAWRGLRSIGPFVLDRGFCDMIKTRNAMAKALGYVDFYDYKVTQAEGFGKARLFGILDTLRAGSDALLADARAALASAKGASALEPWNMGYAMAGDVEKELDPYFPFEKSIGVWGRCFANLGITSAARRPPFRRRRRRPFGSVAGRAGTAARR